MLGTILPDCLCFLSGCGSSWPVSLSFLRVRSCFHMGHWLAWLHSTPICLRDWTPAFWKLSMERRSTMPFSRSLRLRFCALVSGGAFGSLTTLGRGIGAATEVAIGTGERVARVEGGWGGGLAHWRGLQIWPSTSHKFARRC